MYVIDAAECLFSGYTFDIKRVRLEWESSLLHYYFCKGGCIFTHLLVCRLLVWFVYQQDNTKTTDWISRTLGWRVGLLTFGADLHSQRTHNTVTCFFWNFFFMTFLGYIVSLSDSWCFKKNCIQSQRNLFGLLTTLF